MLSHYPHDPITMAGGTTFHFVDDFDEAVARAREAAGPDGLVRLLNGLPGLRLEPVETAHSPLASHVRYQVLSGQLP